MDDKNSLWEKVSCKYILKKIFSLIKVPKALNLIKKNKEIKERLDITLYHYQYYYFFILFKDEKIETIDNIINSPYLKIFPENVKYELIIKYIEAKKLFKNDYIYLNINDNNMPLIQKFKEKEYFNYIIGNFEEQKYDILKKTNCHDNIQKMIEMDINNIDKILFDYNFFFDKNNKLIKNINWQNIKYINLDEFNGNAYDISPFNNLEYLSLSLNPLNENIAINKIKIIISENQYKNIKTLKIKQTKIIHYYIKNIIFETKNSKEKKCFENLKELQTKEKLLNQIELNPKNLQKLNIIYDYQDKLYKIEDIKNSLHDVIQKYPLLTDLNISFYYMYNYDDEWYSMKDLTKEISYFLLNLIDGFENFSLKFYDTYFDSSEVIEKNFNCLFKKIPNRKSKFIFKQYYIEYYNIEYDMIEPYLDKIEELDLSQIVYYTYDKSNCNLAIEEDSSKSSITKIRIKSFSDKNLYIPIKSFTSLNVLDLEIKKINFYIDFPLFSSGSSIIFNNLEYILLKTEVTDLIYKLINNFNKIPNLRFLSLIKNNICNIIFQYHKDIFIKFKSLKRLHTLIMDNKSDSILQEAKDYYSFYPELKNTNIRFCAFSDNLLKN